MGEKKKKEKKKQLQGVFRPICPEWLSAGLSSQARKMPVPLQKSLLRFPRQLGAHIPRRWGCGLGKKQTVCKCHLQKKKLWSQRRSQQKQTFHTWGTNLSVCFPAICQKHFIFSHTRLFRQKGRFCLALGDKSLWHGKFQIPQTLSVEQTDRSHGCLKIPWS